MGNKNLFFYLMEYPFKERTLYDLNTKFNNDLNAFLTDKIQEIEPIESKSMRTFLNRKSKKMAKSFKQRLYTLFVTNETAKKIINSILVIWGNKPFWWILWLFHQVLGYNDFDKKPRICLKTLGLDWWYSQRLRNPKHFFQSTPQWPTNRRGQNILVSTLKSFSFRILPQAGIYNAFVTFLLPEVLGNKEGLHYDYVLDKIIDYIFVPKSYKELSNLIDYHTRRIRIEEDFISLNKKNLRISTNDDLELLWDFQNSKNTYVDSKLTIQKSYR